MKIPEFIIFTKTERRSILILSSILLCIYLSNIFLKPTDEIKTEYTSLQDILEEESKLDKEKIISAAKKVTNSSGVNKNKGHKINKKKWNSPKIKLTAFDPNKTDSLGWVSFGIRGYALSNILKYRSKGGTFRTCHDLYKIYNIDSSQVATLLPYCIIEKGQLQEKKAHLVKKSTPHKAKKVQSAIIDINTADTQSLQTLYGIGPFLSKAIVKERQYLGGFHSIEQLKEIYAFKPEILVDNKGLIICSSAINKININEADIATLKNHKYINYKTAKHLVKYRQQHGSYKDVQDIRNLVIITDSIYNKISPYLKTH